MNADYCKGYQDALLGMRKALEELERQAPKPPREVSTKILVEGIDAVGAYILERINKKYSDEFFTLKRVVLGCGEVWDLSIGKSLSCIHFGLMERLVVDDSFLEMIEFNISDFIEERDAEQKRRSRKRGPYTKKRKS